MGELFQKGSSQLDNLTRDFINGINGLANDKDIQDAGLQGFMMEESGVNNTGGDQGGFFQGITNMFGLGKKDDDENEKVEEEGGEEGGEKIEGRAEGGPFDSRQPILVGEEGPEIVQFDQSGEVIDNENTMDILSGLNMMPDDELMDKSSPNESRSGKFPILSFDTPEDRTSIPDMESNIDGVNRRNTFVNAVTIQRPDLSQGRKKPKTQVIIVDKKSMNMQQPQISNTKPNDVIVRKGQSALSSLLALQSVGALKYT